VTGVQTCALPIYLFHVKSGRVIPVTGTFVRSDFYRSWSDCSGHTVSWGSPCDPCCKPPPVIQSAVMKMRVGLSRGRVSGRSGRGLETDLFLPFDLHHLAVVQGDFHCTELNASQRFSDDGHYLLIVHRRMQLGCC